MLRVVALLASLLFLTINYKAILASVTILLKAPVYLFLLSFLLLIIEFFFQSMRVHPLVETSTVGTLRAYLLGLVTALVVIPRPIGEIARAEVMSRYLNIDREKLLAYVSLERTFDVLVLSSFLLSIFVGPFSLIVVLVFAALLPGIAPLLYRATRNLNTENKLLAFIQSYLIHIKDLIDERRYLLYIATLSVILWLIDFFRVFTIMRAFKVEVSYWEAAFITSASYLTGVLSILPGGLGVYEAVMGALVGIKSDMEKAFAATLYERFFSYWLIVIIGLILLLSGRLKQGPSAERS